MESFLLVIHYLVCFFLIVSILLQAGKGADIGAMFGGASQTVFGGRGSATFLSKLTAGVAVVFLITSIWLAQISKTRSTETVIDKAAPIEQKSPGEAPAQKAPEENNQKPKDEGRPLR